MMPRFKAPGTRGKVLYQKEVLEDLVKEAEKIDTNVRRKSQRSICEGCSIEDAKTCALCFAITGSSIPISRSSGGHSAKQKEAMERREEEEES